MNSQRLLLFILLLLIVQLAAACALWDRKNEDLPEDRRVRVVVFPVRVLELDDVTCTQKFESLEIAGTVKNISPISLLNVRIQAEVFLAGDDEPREEYLIEGAPSPLYPGMSADFVYTEIVERPVAYVELHMLWGDAP
jgi:hypothetical protein